MPIQREVITSVETKSHGNNLAYSAGNIQGCLNSPFTASVEEACGDCLPALLYHRLWQDVRKDAEKCLHGLSAQSCEIQSLFKNQSTGNLLLSTSLSIEKNNLGRINEISHLRVIWVTIRKNAFWQFPHSFVKLLLSGKEWSARSPCR